MQKEDIVELLDRVKLHYQHLSMSDELFYEWFRILKEYNRDDVFKKLDEYLENESNRDRIPMAFDLIDGLITHEQKKKIHSDYLIRCNLCGREMLLSEYDSKHFDRCSSINYLLRIMREQGIKVEYRDLETLDEIKFQKVYEKYKDWS